MSISSAFNEFYPHLEQCETCGEWVGVGSISFNSRLVCRECLEGVRAVNLLDSQKDEPVIESKELFREMGL